MVLRDISGLLSRNDVRRILSSILVKQFVHFTVLSYILFLVLLNHVQISVSLSTMFHPPALLHWLRRRFVLVFVVYVGVLFFHRVRVLVGFFLLILSHLALLDDKLPVWSRLLYNALY